MHIACGDDDALRGLNLDFHAFPHLEGVSDADADAGASGAVVVSDHHCLLAYSKVHFPALLHECHHSETDAANVCCLHLLMQQVSCDASHPHDEHGAALWTTLMPKRPTWREASAVTETYLIPPPLCCRS